MISRRKFLYGFGALAATGAGGAYFAFRPKRADIGFSLTAEELNRAKVFLAAHPVIDVHAHPGRTFVRGASDLNWLLRLYQMLGTFEAQTIADMRAGGVSAACFSAVADFSLLALADGKLKAVRGFAPGEAWTYYKQQIENLKKLASDGLVYPVLQPADILEARRREKPGAIFAVEGADFVEEDLARIATARADGVRMITLVHYTASGRIGDIMTAPPVHGGLSDLGREVVAELGRQRLMLDLSHASEKTAFDALKIATGPVVLTHTLVARSSTPRSRSVSLALARAVAATGGYVGAWPAGIGIGSLAGFVDRIIELADLLGTDHVAIGSDMDANYRPVFDNYRNMPLLAGALLKRGLQERELSAILGGNFLRVFDAAEKKTRRL